MAYFLCRLKAPRPSFPADMTAEENALMQQHFGFWTQKAAEKTALAVGPVLDPAGVWGMALVEVHDLEAARALTDDDPVMRAGSGFSYDVHSIPSLILRPAQGAA